MTSRKAQNNIEKKRYPCRVVGGKGLVTEDRRQETGERKRLEAGGRRQEKTGIRGQGSGKDRRRETGVRKDGDGRPEAGDGRRRLGG